MGLANVLTSSLQDPERIALWSPQRKSQWRDLSEEFILQRRRLMPLRGQRVGLAFRADLMGLARLAALEAAGCHAFLFDADLPPTQREDWGQQLQLATVLSDAATRPRGTRGIPAAGDTIGSVTILTSGTTGQPKAVRHRWDGLARPVRPQPGPQPPCWLLAFRPHLYAGLQVILQALLNQGTLVVAPPDAPPAEVVDLMAAARVQFASATPSFWRRLLIASDPAVQQQVPLVQITLGGEVVDQAILDQLHEVFPAARLVHIYATTELGRCFSVADGRAGFPRTFLQQASPDGVELQVRDGELWVRSANAMSGYDPRAMGAGRDGEPAGWFGTGDLVDVRSDRVYFVGRNSDMINVGGNKVYPIAIERVIRQLAEVADVRVYGQSSSLAGQLVACQIVPAAGQDAERVRRRVQAHCQARLDRFQLPRIIEIVERLPLTEAGKLVRQTPADRPPT